MSSSIGGFAYLGDTTDDQNGICFDFHTYLLQLPNTLPSSYVIRRRALLLVEMVGHIALDTKPYMAHTCDGAPDGSCDKCATSTGKMSFPCNNALGTVIGNIAIFLD